MKITKFGHSCLLVEENGVRVLTDPGTYSTGQNELKNVDFVLITHEHTDHIDLDSLRFILNNNPEIKIITNKSVGMLLEKEGIGFELVEDGQKFNARGVLIEGFGNDHGVMHSSIKLFQNTGYFIASRLFYPGDNLIDPGKQVEILALPVAGPWMKLSEGIDYALKLEPKVCFPVHDGILKSPSSTNTIPPRVLEPKGIKFIILEIGKEMEL